MWRKRRKIGKKKNRKKENEKMEQKTERKRRGDKNIGEDVDDREKKNGNQNKKRTG